MSKLDLQLGIEYVARKARNYTDNVKSQLSESIVEISDKKIDKPTTVDDNKFPRAKNGNVEWVEHGLPTDTQTANAVQNWLNAHPEATTTVQDGSLTPQKMNDSFWKDDRLANINNIVYCSKIGMKPSNSGSTNMNLLIDAINDGKKIVVDGKYKLSASKSIISKNLLLEGNGTGSGFVFDDSGDVFSIVGDVTVDIRNITFTQNASSGMLCLFKADENTRMENFVIDGCIFNRSNSGSIRMLDFRMDANTYPDVNAVGINTMNISNNFIDDTHSIFCVISNAPVRYALITGNSIKNLYSEIFHIDVENNTPYQREAKLSREHFYISNNLIKNDDNFWSMDRAANYLCFILIEGYRIDYVNNHFEGVHSVADCGLYDIYPSCSYFFSHDNAWINNAVFSNSVSYTTFMKLKGIEKKAVISNNVYDISDDFAERVGNEGLEIKTLIFDIFDSNPEIVITGNTIKGQTILPPSMYDLKIVDFYYKINSINAKKWNGGPFYTCDGNSASIFHFEGNILRFQEVGENGIYLMYGSGFGTSNFMNEISIKNNIISLGKWNSTRNVSLLQSVNSVDCNIRDVRIFDENGVSDKVYGITSNGCIFKNGIVASDIYIKSKIVNFFLQRNDTSPRYNKDVSIKSEILAGTGNTTMATWQESALGQNETSMLYRWDIDIITPSYTENHKFDYIRYKENGTMKYKGVGKDGVTIFDVEQTDARQDYVLSSGNNINFGARINDVTSGRLDQVSWSFNRGGLPKGSIISIKQETAIM